MSDDIERLNKIANEFMGRLREERSATDAGMIMSIAMAKFCLFASESPAEALDALSAQTKLVLKNFVTESAKTP
jgi:hypothetical protein